MANNEIDLRLGKGEYVGGDTIYGAVYLRVQEQIFSSMLKLVIRGFHTCKYGYKYMEQGGGGGGGGGGEGEGEEEFSSRVGQRNMLRDILKQEIVISEGLFPTGYYAYPFKFQLPHNLPGSFSVQCEDMDSSKSWEAVVRYSISAILTGPPKLSAESEVVVYESSECRNRDTQPPPLTSSGGVRTFFCLSRGTVKVTCRLQQTSYVPTSKIDLGLDITNNSSVDVSGCTVNLVRVIKLQGLDRMRDEEELSTHTVLSTVLESQGQGCPHNNTLSRNVVLDLTATTTSSAESAVGIPPNTSGSLVKCHYVIDVNVHIPWGPDIELRQPLLIRAADNELWKVWTPPTWVNECKAVHSTGNAAVPETLLNSIEFTGIPGFRPEI